MWTQLITPNLGIAYTGGWCLKAVADAFSIPANSPNRYASAIDDWNAEKAAGHTHSELPPKGVYVPVYFTLGTVPAGHVAISLPDGRVASSTQEGNHQGLYIHPNLNHLINLYAKYNGSCTYLGWSETVDKLRVVNQTDQRGGNQVTDIQDFSNCVITVRGSWPTDQEKEDWKDSGLSPYEWIQKNVNPPVFDLYAFDRCYITVASRWPTDDEREAWKSSGLTPYEWVQKNILNPLEQANTDALYQRAAQCEAQLSQVSDELAKTQSNNVNLQTQLAQAQEALEAIQEAPATKEEADCKQRVDEAVNLAFERFEAQAEANPFQYLAAWLGSKLGTNKKK